MRELTSLSDAAIAKRLADYLLTQGIKTKLMAEKHQTEVWIIDEDRVEEARGIYQEFQAAPDDPKYQSAKTQAQQIRTEAKKEEDQYWRKIKRGSDVWSKPSPKDNPITWLIMLLCVGVTIYTGLGNTEAPYLERALQLAFTDGATVTPHPFNPDLEYVRYDKITGLKKGQVWRAITPIFLHFSIWHLAINLYLFHGLAGLLELRKGKLWLLGFVLASAMLTNAAQWLYPDLDIHRTDWVFGIFGGLSAVNFALFGFLVMKTYFAPEPALRLTVPFDLYGVFLILVLLWALRLVVTISIVSSLAGFLFGCLVGLVSKLIPSKK